MSLNPNITSNSNFKIFVRVKPFDAEQSTISIPNS